MQAQIQRARVALFGASGYSGVEATKLLACHPGVRLDLVTSDRWSGETVGERLGLGGEAARLRYVSNDLGLAAAAGVDAAVLATPAEVSLELVPALLAAGMKVVDLSGAFRLADLTLYPDVYGFVHDQEKLQSKAVYGIPELFGAALRGARLIASAGCYATAAALAVGPVVRAGLVAPGTIVVDALSGTTGAGRSAKEELSFSEVGESAKAYRVLTHQHTPEIEQTLARLKSDPSSSVLFTPHLVPMRRGILATSYVPLKPGTTRANVHSAYTHTYAYSKLVRLRASANDVKTGDVSGTNRCDIGFALDARTSTLVVVSALDNLRKGAASQAIQNLNLALGLEETAGLVASGPEGGEA